MILEGLVQTYEFTYELAINTTRDYLVNSGHPLDEVISPRVTVKQALNDRIMTDGTVWMSAIEDRNLTSHTYDEEIAKEVVKNICEKYFFIIEDLYNYFKKNEGIEG